MNPYDHTIGQMESVAAKRAGLDGWQMYSVKAMYDNDDPRTGRYIGAMVSGCVYARTITRGPRKGRPDCRSVVKDTTRHIMVTTEEMDAVAAKYEAETGKCWNCDGTGQARAWWSSSTGLKTKPCPRCDATGNAPKEADHEHATD